jgi:threonine/homoserine/homoserine lactone efflux protein
VITWQTLFAFSAIAFLLIILPGPSVLFIVGRALQHGRREALISVVGNSAGVFVHVILVAIGVGAVLAASEVAFIVLKVAGGMYLIYLGIQQIRHRRDGADAVLELEGLSHGRVSAGRLLRESFVVGVTNPKTLVFMVAVLPQFTDPALGSVGLQIITLGLVFVAMAIICDGTYALLASSARAWFAKSPRRIAGVRAAGGGMIAALGVLLLLSRRPA